MPSGPVRVLVTGSREWADAGAVQRALDELAENHGPLVVVHGGARGADAIADAHARRRGWSVEVHPAQWRRADGSTDRAAGPRRNALMVELGAYVCLGFPLGVSRGTRDCMRRAGRAGIRVVDRGA